MPHKTICLDLDDTLGSLKERLQDIYRRELNDPSINYNDWANFGNGSAERYGISHDRLLDLFVEDQSLELQAPHDGAIEVTAILKSMDYTIEIVTARGWHPNAYEVTRKWLDDNYISYDRINIVPLYDCKETVTRHIENIHLFVDDRVDHCTNMLNSGRVQSCLVMAQPWNTSAELNTGLHRIHTLYDILGHL